MPQKKRELLNEGHLDKEVSQADGEEVAKDAPAVGFIAAPAAGFHVSKRQQYQQQTGDHRLDQGEYQYRVTQLQQGETAAPVDGDYLRQRAPFEKLEEVGPVVPGRSDIEFVAVHVIGCPGSQQGYRTLVEIGLRQDIVQVDRVIPGYPRKVDDIESAFCAEFEQRTDFRCLYSAVFNHQRAGIPTAYQHQAILGVVQAALTQRLDSRGEQTQSVPRGEIHPAGYRQHAAGLQMFKVLSESLDRVEIVFTQAVYAAGGGAGCIQQ